MLARSKVAESRRCKANLPNEEFRHDGCRYLENLAESLNLRAHSKERAIAVVLDMETDRTRNTDHAKKDTSRQNRTPQSGQGMER
jgi:hypothetical protein